MFNSSYPRAPNLPLTNPIVKVSKTFPSMVVSNNKIYWFEVPPKEISLVTAGMLVTKCHYVIESVCYWCLEMYLSLSVLWLAVVYNVLWWFSFIEQLGVFIFV